MRNKILLLILSVCLLLTACGTDYASLPEEYQFGTDFSNTFVGNSTLTPFVTPAEDGYYTMIGRYIYYIDAQTLQAVPLCSKPECRHAAETDPSKVFSCNAFVFAQRTPFLQYYEGNIYTIGKCADEKGMSFDALIRISKDGNAREYIRRMESPDNVNYAIHRGVFYMDSTEDNATLWALPMNELADGDFQPIITAEENFLYPSMVFMGSKLYLTGTTESGKTDMYRYDTVKKTVDFSTVSDNAYQYLNMYRDRLVYCAIDAEQVEADYITYDPLTENATAFIENVVLEENHFLNVYSDGCDLYLTQVLPMENGNTWPFPAISGVKTAETQMQFSSDELVPFLSDGKQTVVFEDRVPFGMAYGIVGGDESHLFIGTVGYGWDCITLDVLNKNTYELKRVIEVDGANAYPPTTDLPVVQGVK